MKKLMIIASLFGLLSLGACINEDESASVTNVRDAKVAELKSIAAMEQAEASAVAAMAQAEAALKAAEAEAKLAAAAVAEAEAKAEELEAQLAQLRNEQQQLENAEALMENERKQAELEAQLADEETKKAKAEMALARIKAEMEQAAIANEAALLAAELELKKANDALEQANQDLEDAETEAEKAAIEARRAKLQAASSRYAEAVENLITQKTELNRLNSSLVMYTNNLENEHNIKAENVEAWKMQISQYEMQIAAYKQYTNYIENLDELREKRNAISPLRSQASENAYAKRDEFNNIEVNTEAVEEATKAIEESDFYTFISTGAVNYTYDWENSSTGVIEKRTRSMRLSNHDFAPYTTGFGYLNKYYKVEDEETNFYKSEVIGDSISIDIPEFPWDIRNVEIELNENTKLWNDLAEEYVRYSEHAQALYNGKPFNWEFDSAKEEWKKVEIKDGPDAVNAVDSLANATKHLADAEAALPKAEAAFATAEAATETAEAARIAAWDTYNAAVNAYNAAAPEDQAKAQEAIDKAYEAATKADEAVNKAWEDYNKAYDAKNTAADNLKVAKTNYQNAVKNETYWKREIVYYKSVIVQCTAAKEACKVLTDMYVKYNENVEAIKKAIDARNELSVEAHAEKVAIFNDWCALRITYNKLAAEYSALGNLINGDGGNAMSASAIENAIADLEAQIEGLQEQIADMSAIENAEALVAEYKVLIAGQEAKVKAAEQAVAETKAALQAISNEEAGE